MTVLPGPDRGRTSSGDLLARAHDRLPPPRANAAKTERHSGIWGADPHAAICINPNPMPTVRVVDDGVVVTRQSFEPRCR
jgi:hypothetical protein